MKIPYANLKRFYEKEKEDIDLAIKECFDNSWFIKGPAVSALEFNIEELCKQSAACVSSGTAALLLAYETLGVEQDEKVLLPSFTFMSTAEMLTKLKIDFEFVDCNLDDYTIDIQDLERKINKKTKAVIGVDLFGHTCDYDRINDLCGNNIKIVQDAAQSFGGSYKGKINGSYNLTCFSFYPAKNLFCFGDGGAVVGDKNIISKIRMASDHGRTEKYHHEFVGWNERLDSIQANILCKLIKKISFYNEQRQKIAKIYNDNIKIDTYVKTKDYCNNVYNQYTVLVEDRNKIYKKLLEEGIECGIMWPKGLHQQPAYKNKYQELPNTELVSNKILSLPCFPFMNENEINYIIEKFNKII